jgi:NAD(P)-dependent dehydrogenase (short-subunit alcohol dehydrogenase family)
MNKSVLELFDLTGKVGLVIGGAQNLGLEMACGLAEVGAKVVITSRQAEKAIAAAEALARTTHQTIQGIECDAGDEDSVRRCFLAVQKQFGQLDILINNAGGTAYTGGGFAFIDRQTKDFDATVTLNLKTMFFCCREAVRIMTDQQRGSIINIASISGVVGRERSIYPDGMRPNMQDYSLVKGGVIAFTRDLAAEIGKHGIRVNAISPGGFARPDHNPEFVRRYSRQTMLGRMGTDGLDLKGAAVFLASEASSYITGHNLVVDGGFSAW